LVFLVAGFLYLRSKRSASSQPGATGSVGTSTGPAVYEIAPGYLQGGTSAGAYGNSVAYEQGLAAGAQGGSTGNTVGGTGASSSGSSTAGSVNANAGFGETTIGGQSYDILGILSGPKYNDFLGYNVKPGAPVYYSAGGAAPTQGTKQAVTGAQVLVPTAYAGDVLPGQRWQGG
jgi:hypothetical protein